MYLHTYIYNFLWWPVRSPDGAFCVNDQISICYRGQSALSLYPYCLAIPGQFVWRTYALYQFYCCPLKFDYVYVVCIVCQHWLRLVNVQLITTVSPLMLGDFSIIIIAVIIPKSQRFMSDFVSSLTLRVVNVTCFATSVKISLAFFTDN